jgi:hypothetical protein
LGRLAAQLQETVNSAARGRCGKNVIIAIHCCQFLEAKFVSSIKVKPRFGVLAHMLMLFTLSPLHRKLVITDDY